MGGLLGSCEPLVLTRKMTEPHRAPINAKLAAGQRKEGDSERADSLTPFMRNVRRRISI
jgi:hypothetical protein